jgi:hypothetical protein
MSDDSLKESISEVEVSWLETSLSVKLLYSLSSLLFSEEKGRKTLEVRLYFFVKRFRNKLRVIIFLLYYNIGDFLL